jgi:hypothetical protein
MSTILYVDLFAENGEDFRSDSIDTVAYDRESKTIYVEFNSGDTLYAYNPVEESTYNLFISAPSLNYFWRNHITDEFGAVKYDDAWFEMRKEPVVEDDYFTVNSDQEDALATLRAKLTGKARFSVSWEIADSTIGGKPEFFADDETDALRQFNEAMEYANRLELGYPDFTITAVTHHLV